MLVGRPPSLLALGVADSAMEARSGKRPKPAAPTPQKQPRVPKAAKKSSFNLLKCLRDNLVVVLLVAMIFAGFVLKYFEDDHHFKEGFVDFGDNAYEVMGVSRSATEQEIKAKYRQLNHKWHPDKNPNCEECKDKFMKIKAAYKILGNPELKALYDRTDGRTVDVISSATTDITHHNFDELVRNSGDVWVVQVYSDDSPECQYFSKHWEDAAERLGAFARFGRINKLMHPKVMKKLPIKVQLLPAVIMFMPGGSYDLFPLEVLRGYDVLKRHFLNAYPNTITTCKDHQEFKKRVGGGGSGASSGSGNNRPALLFRHSPGNVLTPTQTSTPSAIPLPLMHVALRYRWAFDTFWISTDVPMHSDEHIMPDLMGSSQEESALLLSTAFFQLVPNLEATAMFYAPAASQLLATAPYVRDAVAPLIANINSMVALSYPPLQLTVDSFDHLCTNAGSTRDRFCLITVGSPRDTVPQRRVLEKLARYEHLASVASVFTKKPEEGENARPPVAGADLQLVNLSDRHSSGKLKSVVGDGSVLLVDAKRDKFCVVGAGRYGCEFEDDGDLEWVASLSEGAFDTVTWFDAPPVFGGRFRDAALASAKAWYRLF